MTSSVTPDDKLCGPRQPEVTDLADPRSWRRALRWARPSRYANRNPGSHPALAVKFHNGGLPVNKRAGDSARKGAVRKRSQLKTKVEGEAHWTKRSKAKRLGSSWIRKRVRRQGRSSECGQRGVDNSSVSEHLSLFSELAPGPEGLRYQPDFISERDERELVVQIRSLPLEPIFFWCV